MDSSFEAFGGELLYIISFADDYERVTDIIWYFVASYKYVGEIAFYLLLAY